MDNISQSESYDVFISYRRTTGRDTARLLQQTLKNRGYSVFFDYDSLRDDIFDKRIESAIKSSKVFILVMTQGVLDTCMNNEDWIRKEIDFAKKYGVKIVPIAPSDKNWSFPQEMPWADLRFLHVSSLDMGPLFDESIDKLILDRFPPVVSQPNNKPDKSIASKTPEINPSGKAMGILFIVVLLLVILGGGFWMLKQIANQKETSLTKKQEQMVEQTAVRTATTNENNNSLEAQKQQPLAKPTQDEQGEVLSKAFGLGILIFGKFAAVVNNKQQEVDNEDELKEMMSELKIPLSRDLSKEYKPDEHEAFTKLLGDQMWADPNYISKTLDSLYGPMSSDVFNLGFRFLPWAIKDELRNNASEKTKMIELMQKIALPQHFINKIVSLDIDEAAKCRDALIQYFKHHLEHIGECPNCHTRVANDYTQCPVCNTVLQKNKVIICTNCNGRGFTMSIEKTFSGQHERKKVMCTHCNGRGTIHATLD